MTVKIKQLTMGNKSYRGGDVVPLGLIMEAIDADAVDPYVSIKYVSGGSGAYSVIYDGWDVFHRRRSWGINIDQSGDFKFTGYTLKVGVPLDLTKDIRIDVPLPPNGKMSDTIAFRVSVGAGGVESDYRDITFTVTWDAIYPDYSTVVEPVYNVMRQDTQVFWVTVNCNVPSPKDVIVHYTFINKDNGAIVNNSMGGLHMYKGCTTKRELIAFGIGGGALPTNMTFKATAYMQ